MLIEQWQTQSMINYDSSIVYKQGKTFHWKIVFIFKRINYNWFFAYNSRQVPQLLNNVCKLFFG